VAALRVWRAWAVRGVRQDQPARSAPVRAYGGAPAQHRRHEPPLWRAAGPEGQRALAEWRRLLLSDAAAPMGVLTGIVGSVPPAACRSYDRP